MQLDEIPKRKYKEFVRDEYKPMEICPWWKGHVYDDVYRRVTRVAPLGFNILFCILYEFSFYLRCWRISSRRFARKQYDLRMENTNEHR